MDTLEYNIHMQRLNSAKDRLEQLLKEDEERRAFGVPGLDELLQSHGIETRADVEAMLDVIAQFNELSEVAEMIDIIERYHAWSLMYKYYSENRGKAGEFFPNEQRKTEYIKTRQRA